MRGPSRGSALIVAVAEAEPAVAALRGRLDPSATLGVPAHLTVLYPFMPADLIDDSVTARLASLFAAHTPFRLQLTHSAWFGDVVLYLEPEDPDPFRRLTSSVEGAFPDYPPYQGRHTTVTPHLTIGDGSPTDELRAAESAVLPHLPITAEVEAVTLIEQDVPGGTWRPSAHFPLLG